MPKVVGVGTPIQLGEERKPCVLYAMEVSTLIHLRGKTGRTLPYAVGVESPMPFLVTAASFTDMPYVKGVTAPTLS